MADANNIFISWSKERSRAAAEALRDWIPNVLQAAKPWMSAADIEKGSRGLDEIAGALEGMKVGIICLTPENLKEDWILYEAGAFSKTLGAKTRVCTYLLAGLRPQDVKPPLGMFQATKAEEDDTRKLIHTINNNLEITVPEKIVNTVFDKMWPDLKEKLARLPAVSGATPQKRDIEEMVAENLELNREMAVRIPQLFRDDISRVFGLLEPILLSLRRPVTYFAPTSFATVARGTLADISVLRGYGTEGMPLGPLSPTEKVDPERVAARAGRRLKARRRV